MPSGGVDPGSNPGGAILNKFNKQKVNDITVKKGKMFKYYGIAGILLILLVELNFIFEIQPFADWYYPIIWFGYILVIDAIIFKLKKKSLISSRFPQFLGLLILSIVFRYVLQIFTGYLNNWTYTDTILVQPSTISFIGELLHKSITLPALFETIELFVTLHIFDKEKLYRKYKITKKILYGMISLGVICSILPFIAPILAFPLMWIS